MLKTLEKERAIAMQQVEYLDKAIASLHAVDGRVAGTRVMSAGAKKKISAAQRKRWRLQKRAARAAAKKKA